MKLSPTPREKVIYRVTFIGSAVNLLLVALKFAAGVLGRSSAMIADAVHSLSDLRSDVIVVVFVRLSSKPEDEDHAYGHGKYETLASVIVGLMLLCAGVALGWEGVEKSVAFFRGERLGQPGWLALWAGLFSIALKEWLYHYTARAGRAVRSDALIANAWHHRSDSLTSIATVAGIGGAMALGPGWAVLDPLAASVVSLFIVASAFGMMKPGIDQLLERSLPAEDLSEIADVITSVPGVRGYHRLRTRAIGSGKAVEVHVKMDGNLSLTEAHNIASELEQRLKKALGPETHTAIHMEPCGR